MKMTGERQGLLRIHGVRLWSYMEDKTRASAHPPPYVQTLTTRLEEHP